MNPVTTEHPIGDILLEPATHQDLDPILDIEQTSSSAPWTRKMFETELHENPFGYVTVARTFPGTWQTAVVGFVCFWVVFEELRLMNLAVAGPARRRGVATSLVRHALACGRAHGASRAVLEVRTSNLAARRLYEQAGFRQIALRTNYYSNPQEDAVLMAVEPLGGQVAIAVKAKNDARASVEDDALPDSQVSP
jgi:ribosomal-protein-alanine N-acetyltransferase